MIRFGIGYDVHQFAENRKLVLGGIEIPYTFGLAGHSDADVLLHAICDAILGALALGDIGKHFPNTSDKYKNISSLNLLKEVMIKIKGLGYEINNIDSTLIAEMPKILPFVEKMQEVISDAINCDPERISIKATTNENMGFIGRGEGIAAFAIASLIKSD